MTFESDAVAGATIELLEARLRRLTYLLTGATDWTGVPTAPEKPTSLDETVSRKLARLERELERLSRSVPAVRDVLQLRMCRAVGMLSIPTTNPIPPYTTRHLYILSSTPSSSIQLSPNPIKFYKSPN
jgi:transposase